MRASHYALKTLPVKSVKIGLPEAWLAQEKAIEQKRKRKAAAAAKAANLKSQERDAMDDSVEIHAPEDALQLPPTKRKSDGSSKSKRAKTATGSGSKATGADSAGRPSRSREQKKTMSSSVSVVERPRSDGVSGTKGSEHHRERSRRSHGSDRHHDSPRSNHSSRHDSGRRESGEWSRHRSSGGSSSRRQADSTDVLGLSRVSLRAMDVRPSGSSTHSHHHHHKTSVDRRSLSSSSRASVDRRSPPGHYQDHGRRESSEKSGSSYVSRHEVQLSPALSPSPERRTITVIPSPTRPEGIDEPAGVTGPVEVDDPATVPGQTDAVDGPAGDGPTGDRWARGPVIATDDEPAEVADPARHQEPAGDSPAHDDDDPAGVAGPAHRQDQAVNDPARMDEPVAHGTPAGNTPAAGHDSSLSSDFSTIFPSQPKSINQNQLVDFMSMWTLMQRRMDLGITAPDVQLRPAAQTPTPTPRDDDTPPRKSKTPPRTPDRWPRMPVRRPRTPVRRARVTDESRDSTRSRSPIGRSSSSESARDASPVNFSAALDSEDKLKDRSITDYEDDYGSQKVSAAQYQLFHQAVTSSKGTFKVNPVGHAERPGQQWQRPDLTVKQVFQREPCRLKIHRDAHYVPKPPWENGFSYTKTPASYQMSQRMCLDAEELVRRSAIYASLADSMVAYVIEELSPKDERTKLLREKLAINTGGPSLSGIGRVCSGFQSPAVAPWCLVEEFWLPASGLVYREDCAVWRFARSRSRAQGTSEQSQSHQTSGQDGWVFSHIRPEAPWD